MNYFIKLSEEILAKNNINVEGLKKREILDLACSLVQAKIKENEGDKKNNEKKSRNLHTYDSFLCMPNHKLFWKLFFFFQTNHT